MFMPLVGARMMTAAREALVPFGKDAPLLIAVTVLTSMEASDLVDLGMTLSPADYAERLAALTQKCGLDGVVCSAQEAVRFKQVFGQSSNWLRRAFVRRGVKLVTSAAL